MSRCEREVSDRTGCSRPSRTGRVCLGRIDTEEASTRAQYMSSTTMIAGSSKVLHGPDCRHQRPFLPPSRSMVRHWVSLVCHPYFDLDASDSKDEDQHLHINVLSVRYNIGDLLRVRDLPTLVTCDTSIERGGSRSPARRMPGSKPRHNMPCRWRQVQWGSFEVLVDEEGVGEFSSW